MNDTEIIEETIQDIQPSIMKMSETIGKLADALSKAQGTMSSVGKGKEGYGYNYADLASVIDTVRTPFSENGIAFSQGHYRTKIDGKTYVGTESLLMHSSGEWLLSTLEIPLPQMKQLQPAQLMGVVATYARRYLLQAQAGLAYEDTDGAVK